MDQQLLKLLAAGHVFGGLLLCYFYFIDSLHPSILHAIYAAQPAALSNDPQLIFWICIFGPTIASWGLLFLAVVHQFFQTPNLTLWNSMLGSILIWAPLDSTLCILNKMYVGAVVNGMVTLVFVILLARILPLARGRNLR